VVYPLIDVRRAAIGVRELVSALEGAVIEYCAQFGVRADCRAAAPGCTSTVASSPASGYGSVAAAAITDWR